MRWTQALAIGVLLVGGGGANSASGGMKPEMFPWVRPLTPASEPQRTIGSFRLDEVLFLSTAEDYANLRVFDDRGLEAPCLVRPLQRSREIVREVGVGSRNVDLKILPENRLAIVAEREDGASRDPITLLAIKTGLRDFEKTVTVSSSADRSNWRLLVQDSPIYDYSRFLDLRNNRVRIPADTNRYYRIEIANIVEERLSPLVQIAKQSRDGKTVGQVERTSLNREEFRMDRLEFLSEREVKFDIGRKLRGYSVRNVAVTNSADRNVTIVTFETDRVPLREIGLSIADRHFSRTVQIEGNERVHRRAGWTHVAQGAISRVPMGSVPIERPYLVIPTTPRFPAYRLTILNLDSPPLAISGVRLDGEVHECVFRREAGRAYTVHYGARKGVLPRYDIAGAMREARQNDVDEFRVEEPKSNPIYAGRSMGWWADQQRRFLLGAIVLMVLGLLAIVARTARKVEKAVS